MLISAGSGARQLTLRSVSLPFSVTVWVMLQLAAGSMRDASDVSRSEVSARLTGSLLTPDVLGLALPAGAVPVNRENTKTPPAIRTAAAMAATTHVVSIRL